MHSLHGKHLHTNRQRHKRRPDSRRYSHIQLSGLQHRRIFARRSEYRPERGLDNYCYGPQRLRRNSATNRHGPVWADLQPDIRRQHFGIRHCNSILLIHNAGNLFAPNNRYERFADTSDQR